MKWILCHIGLHKYYMIKRVDNHTRKMGCRWCKKLWGMNDRVKALIEWDADLATVHGEKYP